MFSFFKKILAFGFFSFSGGSFVWLIFVGLCWVVGHSDLEALTMPVATLVLGIAIGAEGVFSFFPSRRR
ncbi:hypothetical protein [Allorhizobium borbori]|uniref:Uncharacterized protein n=1 Tax=Allorhizobium borbori TaxID=485907 RepID=A0A7W6P1R3_9HYPH|nr:hypothetical protein [Allorhizobium borbori]MBB4103074.1 hypothetical protein [Allorhizobium borbori]